jgi:hypothetical protein
MWDETRLHVVEEHLTRSSLYQYGHRRMEIRSLTEIKKPSD